MLSGSFAMIGIYKTIETVTSVEKLMMTIKITGASRPFIAVDIQKGPLITHPIESMDVGKGTSSAPSYTTISIHFTRTAACLRIHL